MSGNVASSVANTANDVANVAKSHELNELEKSIFEFVISNAHASTKDIAKAVGATEWTVQRSIKELERKEIIRKAGTRNNIEWIILG